MKTSESPEPSPTGGVGFGAYAQGSPAGPHGSLNNQQVVRAAEARFVNGELARAISVRELDLSSLVDLNSPSCSDLIETYRDVVQVLSPVVAWDHFDKNWEAAGRNAEAMSPTGECLCLVMQVRPSSELRFRVHELTLNLHLGMGSSILGPQVDPGADSTVVCGLEAVSRTRLYSVRRGARGVREGDG